MKTDNRLQSVVTIVVNEEWLRRSDPWCCACDCLITPGDLAHMVRGLGFCCDNCAKPTKS